jgi:Holliday junction resolvase RusA-like endonuclease
MRILHLENIKIISKNKKYILLKNQRRLILSSEYRDFKKLLVGNIYIPKIKLSPPYQITITLQTYLDIDAPLQCILDALQESKVLDNDRNIEYICIKKYFLKKGELGSIKIDIDGACYDTI